MFRRIGTALAASAAVATLILGPAHAQSSDGESVEVLHWWTAGSEAAALNVLKENLETEGVTWKDMPVAGGAGTEAMTVLRARVTSGNAPTAVQLLGFDVTDWAEQDVLANLDPVAEEEGWGDVIPAALQDFAKYDDHWVAAPVNIHSTNWIWLNKAAFDKAGGQEPTTWDEFIALLDKFKEQGITPLAYGGQAWQDTTVFENVVLSTGGPDFYKKAILDLDSEALGSDTMKTVFDRMTQLHDYVDENFSGRDWNLATAMVIDGSAGVQVMGDWAKGEFKNAGQEADKDFVCFRFPGTQGNVTFNSDMFAMFEQEGNQDAQFKLASAIEDPSFQVAFNTVKGSVPARTDVSDEEFGPCGKKGIKDVKEASTNGTLMGSLAHGYAAPAGVKNAFFDVVTAQFNGQYDSEEAVEQLVNAVAGAQ
ncbi:ABC transporter substrate-binding protein [Consotaella aegiceratis]|uniref:ABC transporter substrate-binding protein n=1 Tax=Consotaella aegiceratis TaxID=3097961 RepID=UPI002F3EA573